jgi:hypothetical protein
MLVENEPFCRQDPIPFHPSCDVYPCSTWSK